MTRNHQTTAALWLVGAATIAAFPIAARATSSKKHRAKTVTTIAKSKAVKVAVKTVAKAPAKAAVKTSGPRFVDGVAILDNDSGGSLTLGGASPVSVLNKGAVSRRTAAASAASADDAARESSTRSAPGESQSPKPQRPIPPQFSTTDTDGRTISLAQYRGKVVLLDFWATWCPPSRAEAPQLVAIYRKYHAQGFEIVGASLDHNANALSRFTDAQGMTWRQIFGGKDWQSDLAQIYGVNSIPGNVLIGRDGRAVGIDLHGEDLQTIIEYVLAER